LQAGRLCMPVRKGHGGFGCSHVHSSCLQALAVGKQDRTGEFHCTAPKTLIQVIQGRHEAATVFGTVILYCRSCRNGLVRMNTITSATKLTCFRA
jgi:hypothetical protein